LSTDCRKRQSRGGLDQRDAAGLRAIARHVPAAIEDPSPWELAGRFHDFMRDAGFLSWMCFLD
jgi:hypothetical protein